MAILAVAGMKPKLSKVLISAAFHWVIEVTRSPTGRAVVAIERLSLVDV
jgi:hypothetical protein